MDPRTAEDLLGLALMLGPVIIAVVVRALHYPGEEARQPGTIASTATYGGTLRHVSPRR